LSGAGVLTGESLPPQEIPPSRTAYAPVGEILPAHEIPAVGKSIPAHEIPGDLRDVPANEPLPAGEDTGGASAISAEIASPDITSWNQRLSLAVLVGSGFMGLRILLGQLVLFRFFSHSKRDPHLVELAAREGAPNVDVRVSHRLSRPISFGLFRSKIILPADYLDESERVRQVLLHEIAHIRRKDAWGNFLMNLAGVLLWFHPAYWFLNAQARLARELIADDWAANKGDKHSYAMELIAIARMRVGSGIAGGIALGILGSRSEFFRRMHMLISRKQNLEMGCSRVWRAAMMTLGLGMMATLAATVGVKPAAAAASVTPAAPGVAERKNEPKPDSSVSIPPTTRPVEVLNLVDTYENLGLSVLDQELKLMADKHLAMIESVDKKLKEIEANIKIVRNLDPEILKSRGERGELDQLRLKTNTNVYDVITSQFKEFPQFKEYEENQEKLFVDFQNAKKSKNEELAQKIWEEAASYKNTNVPVLTDQNIPSVKNMAIQQFENDALKERQSLKDMENRIQAMQQARDRIQAKMTRDASSNGDQSKIEYTPTAKTASLPMDLVSLANSAMEARENLNQAMTRISTMSEGTREFEQARTNLENAKQRKELLEGMIQISLKSATEEMATAKAKHDAGVGNSESYTQYRTQVELLTTILKSMK
jgi:hypothetical protein